MPKKIRQTKKLKKIYNIAVEIFPFSSKTKVSRENVEKVVNAPKNPTTAKKRIESLANIPLLKKK